jgi:RNA polymerase sigma-70 factor, ECF subfamily
MSSHDRNEATEQFHRLVQGDAAAADKLLPFVYDELHALAADFFRREPADHTLQPTALVHEAWLRLIQGDGVEWRGKAQFRALAATCMRRILTDHARRRRAQKRGDGARNVTFVEPPTPTRGGPIDLLELEEVLRELGETDPRQHRIVEMRFFGGLSVEEVAVVLDTSKTTIEREWRMARAWLSSRLRRTSP